MVFKDKNIYDQKDLTKVINLLKKGATVITETDTVMGIVGKKADSIYRIKQRQLDKPLIMLVPRPVETTNALAKKLMKQFWPGALTLIIEGKSYRMPDHHWLLKVLKETGPLYSSSANLAGLEPIETSDEALTHFRKVLDQIEIVRGKQRSKLPSTVFDCDTKQVLRRGGIVIPEEYLN